MNSCETTRQDIEQVENWFTYRQPTETQKVQYEQIRTSAKNLAMIIVQTIPPCADRTAALRKIREAVMTANQAIACGGK